MNLYVQHVCGQYCLLYQTELWAKVSVVFAFQYMPIQIMDCIKFIYFLAGVVVGWGKDETGQVFSNVPKKINLSIVNSTTCAQSRESFSKAVSNRTFCASSNGEGSPCHGDSGGTTNIGKFPIHLQFICN